MVTASEQLDKRFIRLKSLGEVECPSRGWIRAIREALGMTTAQLAKRLKVHQPRIVELEHGEVNGNITVKSLERAAEALGCRLVYMLVPERPLTDTMRERAASVAMKQIAAVDQTMQLEAQGVNDKMQQKASHKMLVEKLLHKPARLWDEL